MKLTNTQKKVIESMRNGCLMVKNVTRVYLINGNTNVSVATFFALSNKGLIRLGKYRQGFGSRVTLTKEGQTIEL